MTTRLDALLSWIDIANKSNIGYDQNERMSFLDLANHRIRPASETDCSALVAGVYYLAGYPISMAAPVYTGSLRQKLVAIGGKAIPVRGMSLPQLTALLVPGAVVLNETHHVVVATRNPSMVLSANIDENGNAAGGQAGNQTGTEVSIRPIWIYHAGWDYVILPPEAASQVSTATPNATAAALPTQTITLSDAATRQLQTVLKVAVDGVIGPMTIGALQARLGTTADRVVNAPSELVRTLQTYLNGVRAALTASGKAIPATWTNLDTDGLWGPKTQAATEEYLLHWGGGFSH